MSNIFKAMKNNTSSFIVFAWPLGVILLVLSISLMYEDYVTSLAGYNLLPTAKVNKEWIPLVVAGLPQIGQIVLFFVYGRDTGKSWAGLLAFLFFLVDISTDVWFKSNQELYLFPIAIVESLFVFTLGSEVLFSISAGFVAEAFGEFMIAFGILVQSILGGIEGMLQALGLGNDKNSR